jgi:hypothetical protein
MTEPQTTSGSMPTRVIVIIFLAALIPIFGVGILLYSSFGGEQQKTFPVVDDYLRHPETVPERVEQIGPELRRIEISHANIDVYDPEGKRYSISADGSYLSRGGEVPVPAQTFAVGEIDFTKLPAILAAAVERSGGNPNNATLEYVDGEPVWRITVWSEGGSNQLLYTVEGEHRPQSNAK